MALKFRIVRNLNSPKFFVFNVDVGTFFQPGYHLEGKVDFSKKLGIWKNSQKPKGSENIFESAHGSVIV